MLIVVDDNESIIKFKVFYNCNLRLEEFFDDYLLDLADKCGFGINGDVSKVSKLIADGWYHDSPVTIDIPEEKAA
jgi:hypothetical protein